MSISGNRGWWWIGFALLLGSAVAMAQVAPPHSRVAARLHRGTASKQSARHAATPLALPAPAMVTPAPAAPVETLRPSQMPPVPPRISYENGQLTVVAENSTLLDILTGIRNATGTEIETTGRTGDRVAAKIGPGPVRDVLLSLLQGSRYDYILLSSNSDPAKVERVILTPKTTGTDVAIAARTSPAPATNAARPAIAIEDDSEDDDQSGFARPVQPAQAPGMMAQPAGNPNGNPPNGSAPNPATPNPDNQGTKSPEQLLEELRQMEQQRRLEHPGPGDRNRGDRPK